jgi:nitrogen regulatory protein PII
MKNLDCCLTLVFPKILEENLVDHLLEHSELASGFTTSTVEGHGAGAAFHSAAEQVRGRAHRVQMQIVMNREDAATLIEHLKQDLPNREVAYWISPVLEFGSFA